MERDVRQSHGPQRDENHSGDDRLPTREPRAEDSAGARPDRDPGGAVRTASGDRATPTSDDFGRGGSAPETRAATPFDPGEFAARIRTEWDSVAEDWGQDHWRTYVEAGAGVVSQRLLEMARVGEGDRVLDLGTGVGEPAATAARKVGLSGHVVGVDLSPRMVEIGRRRLERLGIDHVELQVGDAGRPDFPAGSFDAALSRWVLMLVPDLPAALGRIRDVLRPGGRLAVGLWGHPDRVPMISSALGLAMEMFPQPPEPEGAPTHLWTRGADAFCDLLREAGFTDVEADAVDVVYEWQTAAEYADFITAMAGPLRIAFEALPPPMAQRLRRGLEGVAEEMSGGGPLRLANETLCISGRRP